MGSSFDIRIGIEPLNIAVFTEAYNTTNSRVCMTLDDGPLSCWPVFGGKIRYIGSIEGSHSVQAVLMRRGEIVEETRTEKLTFTTVEDPEMEKEEEEEKKRREEEEEEMNLDEDERVTLDMPGLTVQVPPEKVTIPGNAVQIVSKVSSNQPELFNKYFQHQYACYNIDAGTASSCWPLLESHSIPYFTNLEPGLHTVEGIITHPETNEGIEATTTESRTFYTSGPNNEAAAVMVEIEVDHENHYMPVCRGSDARNQGFYFCGSRGITLETCPDFVAEKIMVAYNAL